MPLNDQQERERAIDLTESFIVQAPAGSGKTGLITQRYLNLLAHVNNPEDILAITFTRKAANEMRERIIDALTYAQSSLHNPALVPTVDKPHEHKTWLLAKQALKQDKTNGWQLIDNPARLRIQTIDSLSASIVKQMPLLARFGTQPGIEENADEIYQKAAQSFITAVLRHRQHKSIEPDLLQLLKSLNNQVEKLISLFKTLLSRRDQWIRHFVTNSRLLDRHSLESALSGYLSHKLNEVKRAAPEQAGSTIFQLLQHVHQHQDRLPDNPLAASHPVSRLQNCHHWPESNSDNIDQWIALAEFLLTGKGQVRKSFRATEGILPASKMKSKDDKKLAQQQKIWCQELYEQLQSYPGFIELLADVKQFPATNYSEHQWSNIEALNNCLTMLLGYLKLEFQSQGKVDFIELSQAALNALEDDIGATDLAMKFDYQIMHILVDEFQDTSHAQYELLRLLTQGWQPDDGRTLFVVGDPMQSIYRFREADVGLYLECRQSGLAGIPLKPLVLTTNFRSEAGIVEWVNRAFKQVLPDKENAMLGAVPVSLADAKNDNREQAVEFIHQLNANSSFQAETVLSLVKSIRQSSPQDTIAILVRSKTHAQDAILALKENNIPVEAIEMERLDQRPMIKNLKSLTRFLLNPQDGIALAALLRSEWCGLTLSALALLFQSNVPWLTISRYFEQSDIKNESRNSRFTDKVLNKLSVDDACRLSRFYQQLAPYVSQIDKYPLAAQVKAAWFTLGGAHMHANKRDLNDAEQFFNALSEKVSDKAVINVAELDTLVERLFSSPDSIDAAESSTDTLNTLSSEHSKEQSNDPSILPPVKVLSIHKSKGLEFDQVIIPHLERKPKNEDAQLVLWQELPSRGQRKDNFLVAPMKTDDASDDRLYQLLGNINKAKQIYETGRLLYVAATRAKKRLYLLAQSNVKDNGEELSVTLPDKSTLLSQLWPAVEHQVEQQLKSYDEPEQVSELRQSSEILLNRLKLDATIQPLTAQLVMPSTVDTLASDQQSPDFEWASENAALIGNLVHEYLQIIAEQGVERWSLNNIEQLKPTFQRYFKQQQVAQNDLGYCVERCVKALSNVLEDDTGRWLLSRHENAQSEFSLSTRLNEQFKTYVIDRTFIDDKGCRWIVDFKTGYHAGGNLESFYQSELERYKNQLATYASVMRQMESRNLRCALYLPMHKKLLEYSNL